MSKILEKSHVIANAEVAPGVFLMELYAPETHKLALPGQFVDIKVGESPVQLLRIPLGIYDVVEEHDSIEVMYQVVGEGTEQLSTLVSGAPLDFIGPIGNGWTMPQAAKSALLVSGGLGVVPLNMLARSLASRNCRVDIVMGAPTEKRLVGRTRLQQCADLGGGSLKVATDDGSEGLHGFCTQISSELIDSGSYDYVCTCGPGPMEKIVVSQALDAGIYCEASLERLMACGVGACLSCIVDTVDGRKRCCVDGPVFDASKVVW